MQTLQCPPEFSKTTARFLKLRSVKFCILEGALFWKDPGGLLLNCVTEDESNKLTKEFHSGSCGGNLYWKSIVNKILRAYFYWPTIFADVFKTVSTCHQCYIFEGRRKLLPLPLRPVVVEDPFQQRGLDFIGEIKPSSSGKYRWILTATDYFTKWIEAIPCKLYSHTVAIKFLEEIISIFGVPRKILTDNAKDFKAHHLVIFFQDNGIVLNHSTQPITHGEMAWPSPLTKVWSILLRDCFKKVRKPEGF